LQKFLPNYPKYFPYFVSCNNSFTLAGRKTNSNKWCCACPKCLFTFAALYPFIGKENVIKIFGQNLFENSKLLPFLRKLLGEGTYKPFECVGTYSEVRAAFYLASQKTNAPKPYLLKYFEKIFCQNTPISAKRQKKY